MVYTLVGMADEEDAPQRPSRSRRRWVGWYNFTGKKSRSVKLGVFHVKFRAMLHIQKSRYPSVSSRGWIKVLTLPDSPMNLTGRRRTEPVWARRGRGGPPALALRRRRGQAAPGTTPTPASRPSGPKTAGRGARRGSRGWPGSKRRRYVDWRSENLFLLIANLVYDFVKVDTQVKSAKIVAFFLSPDSNMLENTNSSSVISLPTLES